MNGKSIFRKQWNRFKDLTLQNKMMLICLFALGFMMVFSLAVIQIITRVYDKKLYEHSIMELEFFCNVVESEMDDIEKLTFEMAMDREVQRQLYELVQVSDKHLQWNAMGSFKDKMNVESVQNDNIMDILFDNRKDIRYEVLNSGEEIPDDLYTVIMEKTSEVSGAYVYLLPTEEFPYILSGRDIRERLNFTLKYLGTLVVAYDIRSIIHKNMDSLSGADNNLCVFCGDTIIYNSNQELFDGVPQVNGKSGYEIVNRGGEKYFRCYKQSAETGWYFVNECTYESIYRTTAYTTRILVGVTIFLVLFLGMLLWKISKNITLPLNNLAESMKIVEAGDFELAREVLLPAQTKDEVGLLSQEFSIMLDKIVLLIKENYEKQITLMDSRYKALQAQINPHFLYNTLNSIGWMIKAGRNAEAQKMITALGGQLRAAFKEEQFATLNEELELLRHYIYIQKIRYDERVEFEIRTEEGVLGIKIPRLSIQPLVENALSYGVDNSPKKCTIRIKAYRMGEWVKIEVSDDGMGMGEERLKEVRSFTMQPRQNGIGLKNINQRLELIYGQHYQFLIDSEIWGGTKVTIAIPWGEDNNV